MPPKKFRITIVIAMHIGSKNKNSSFWEAKKGNFPYGSRAAQLTFWDYYSTLLCLKLTKNYMTLLLHFTIKRLLIKRYLAKEIWASQQTPTKNKQTKGPKKPQKSCRRWCHTIKNKVINTSCSGNFKWFWDQNRTLTWTGCIRKMVCVTWI